MRRFFVAGLFLAVAVAIGVEVTSMLAKRAAQRRQDAFQANLASYRSVIEPGMPRRQVEEILRGRGTAFRGFPAFSEDTAYAEMIKIGEERDAWYCGPSSVNVAIRFQTATNRRALEDPSDIVTGLSLFTLSEDCM